MSVARRGVHADRPVQLGLVGEGLVADDAPIEDVFALWVERVADLNAAIEAQRA